MNETPYKVALYTVIRVVCRVVQYPRVLFRTVAFDTSSCERELEIELDY